MEKNRKIFVETTLEDYKLQEELKDLAKELAISLEKERASKVVKVFINFNLNYRLLKNEYIEFFSDKPIEITFSKGIHDELVKEIQRLTLANEELSHQLFQIKNGSFIQKLKLLFS